MTAPPLGPVIPSSGGPTVAQVRRGRPLPLARPVPVSAAPEDVVFCGPPPGEVPP